QADWNDPGRRRLVMLLDGGEGQRLAVLVNGDRRACQFTLPKRAGHAWMPALAPSVEPEAASLLVAGRSVIFMIEREA
ncbi:MAG TPA: glycogen debranching enzyme GlgX, partial [Mesorhizobium sp.]